MAPEDVGARLNSRDERVQKLRGFEFILWYYRHFQTLFPVERPGSIDKPVDPNADPQERLGAAQDPAPGEGRWEPQEDLLPTVVDVRQEHRPAHLRRFARREMSGRVP